MLKKPFLCNFILFIMLFSVSGYALQTKTAIDNESMSAFISAVELTRIFVEGDKITSVAGLSDFYLLQNDEQQGSIFIKPSAVFLAKARKEEMIQQNNANIEDKTLLTPGTKLTQSGINHNISKLETRPKAQIKVSAKQNSFSIFITTQAGHNYILRLVPKNISSETIMLKPKIIERKISDSFVLTATHQQKLLRLILAMVNRTFSEEYEVTYVDSSKESKQKFGQADLSLIANYKADNFLGKIFHLNNKTDKEILLSEGQFYRESVEAVVLQNHILPPKGSVFVYVVTKQ